MRPLVTRDGLIAIDDRGQRPRQARIAVVGKINRLAERVGEAKLRGAVEALHSLRLDRVVARRIERLDHGDAARIAPQLVQRQTRVSRARRRHIDVYVRELAYRVSPDIPTL